MADTAPKSNTKRRLKAPAQTVREQSEKAQAQAQKPAKNRRLKAAAQTSNRPLKPVGRLLNKVFNRQPFRFIGRILLPRFVRNAFTELRLVQWPNARETFRLTSAVIMFAVAFGILVAGVDYGLDKLFKALIIK